MSPEPPLVSVYVPTKNRAGMLKRALDSLAAQSYPCIEIIVVDDGSTDGTQSYLKECEAVGRVRWLRNETSAGASHCRNQAIECAKGELITGLDDDDELLSEHIENLVGRFQSGQFSCVSACQRERTSTGDTVRTYDAGNVSLSRLLHRNILGNQVLTRTDYLRKVDGFDAELPAFQDYDTWVRLVAAYGPAYKSAQATYVLHKEHESERISSDPARREAGWRAFNQKHAHRMQRAHFKSQRLLRLSMLDEPFSLWQVLRDLNRHNWVVGCALIANRKMKPLKVWLDGKRKK